MSKQQASPKLHRLPAVTQGGPSMGGLAAVDDFDDVVVVVVAFADVEPVEPAPPAPGLPEPELAPVVSADDADVGPNWKSG